MNADSLADADDILTFPVEGHLREIAAIFAAGILRLRERAALGPTPSNNSHDVIEKPLEESS